MLKIKSKVNLKMGKDDKLSDNISEKTATDRSIIGEDTDGVTPNMQISKYTPVKKSH